MPCENIYWGDTHHNIYVNDNTDIDMDMVCTSARDHLDFLTPAYYTPELRPYKPDETPAGKHGFRLESWKSDERLSREWTQVQAATRKYNEDGRFTVFPAYEWQGDSSSGDHNVVFRSEGGEIYQVNTLAELYAKLRGQDAIAIPHHTAYQVGMRGKDWAVHDDDLSPFAEVYSVHGCSESDENWVGLWKNSHMGPALTAGTYERALEQGLHIGAICSGDNFSYHMLSASYGNGLMAVIAPELTRDALWKSFKARRVYGVTGDRIEMRFSVNDEQMGSCIQADGARLLKVAVKGLDALDRIEILRGNRVIHTHCHQGSWCRPQGRSRFLLRIEAGWGATPGEIDVGMRDWQGELTIENGSFVRAVPCWCSRGQTPATLDREMVTFGFKTAPMDRGIPHQNATIFEFDAEPSSTLRLSLNGLERVATVSALMNDSQLLLYREECVAELRRQRGLEPEECERDDTYFHLAHKAKMHRVMPESAYQAEVEFTDDEPLTGETHYRVRVEQRNGQRAWSSPVWVKPCRG